MGPSINLSRRLIMNKKMVILGLVIVVSILAGLIYYLSPYLFYSTPNTNSNPIPTSAPPVKEPTKPLDLLSYQDYLSSLDRSQIQSLASGIKVLEENIPNYSPEEADQSFLAFNTFYIESLNHYNETFWQNETLNAKLKAATRNLTPARTFEYLNIPSDVQKDPEIKELVQQVSSSGLILAVSEGGFYFSENPDFLYNRFSKYLSESLRAFLELRRQETIEEFTNSAGLRIPFAKIGEQVINWEKYIEKYPDSPLKELADFQYQLYLGTFLFGMDNHKVFEDGRLKPEIGKVYQNFSQQYPHTKTANLINRYYQVLCANDFKYNEAVENFLSENHVPILPGLEP